MDYTRIYLAITMLILMSLSFMALIIFGVQKAKGEEKVEEVVLAQDCLQKHIMLFNGENKHTQVIASEWTTFKTVIENFFRLQGHNILELTKESAIKLNQRGNYRVTGAIEVEGESGYLEARMYNVTQDTPLNGFSGVMIGENIPIPIHSYCVGCEQGDEIVMQFRVEYDQDITFSLTNIRIDLY